jgi:hypothetical protein
MEKEKGLVVLIKKRMALCDFSGVPIGRRLRKEGRRGF